jgi:hypothetical protein
VAVAATGELLSTRSGRGVLARSVGKHASYVVTRRDRRALGHAQDTTHPWSRARLRVSSVAVMACHGKVQPIESQDPKAKGLHCPSHEHSFEGTLAVACRTWSWLSMGSGPAPLSPQRRRDGRLDRPPRASDSGLPESSRYGQGGCLLHGYRQRI